MVIRGGRIDFVGPSPVDWLGPKVDAEPGEYEYFCSPHPWMRAKIIVTEDG